LPGNRAISFSHRIAYGLYRVTAAPEGNWAKPGETYVLADKLAEGVMQAAKVEAFERVRDVPASELADMARPRPRGFRHLDGLGPHAA
jgi:isoleucyl-tRNA synthetase